MTKDMGPQSVVFRVAGMVMVALLAGLACVSCGGTAAAAGRAPRRAVALVPQLGAGAVGWCMAASEGGCAAGRSRPPVVAETWSGGSDPVVTVGYAITTSQVRAVSVDGSNTPTRAQPGLPDGLRAVVVELPGLNTEDEPFPRFTPLNGKGEPIPQASGRGEEISSGVISSELPTRRVGDPGQPTSGVCRISSGHVIGGLTTKSGEVVTTVKRFSGLIGEGFLSCASTTYSYRGWPLTASVLLSAGDPAASPARLPEMRPLPGHPGLFIAPGSEGPSMERALLVRRIPGAWLIVSGAKLSQRLGALADLHAKVDL